MPPPADLLIVALSKFTAVKRDIDHRKPRLPPRGSSSSARNAARLPSGGGPDSVRSTARRHSSRTQQVRLVRSVLQPAIQNINDTSTAISPSAPRFAPE